VTQKKQEMKIDDIPAGRELDALVAVKVWVAGERAPRVKSTLPSWRCEYCGLVHPGGQLHCWDGVNGCGAPKPGCDEPPRAERLPATANFYVNPPKPNAIRYLRRSFEDFKLKLGERILAAYQETIKCML
jgi:hypothetical protein